MKADTKSSQAEKEQIPKDEDTILITRLSFYIGGYGGPSYSLELSLSDGKWQEKALLYDRAYYHKEAPPQPLFPSPGLSFAAWMSEWNELNVSSWKERYENPHCLDGTQWSLEYEENGVRHESGGSNRHPRGWRKFMNWLHKRYPEIR